MSDCGPELVRVAVDPERCIGSGTCEMLEEETFLIDDDSVVATVIGGGVLPADRAATVADRCPGKAILVQPVESDDAPDSDPETSEG